MKKILPKLLIIANVILLAIVMLLLLSVLPEISRLSKYNTSQNVVLCNYIEDLQLQTGIDRKLSPNCQGDIELISKTLNK